ncbi:PDC sensor domain-containing protein [Saccharomonospora cyanea]|uniref:Cache domain-containing protein n=1 Tax=Saccharomonospora cyanea NA-134 TaxID=882082 RepID=H5XM11_9PSEU|nr:hypothetical protein [Saccharomonospora cyanea]EHR63090.1 cache domain-containing protein [Saccharomonospora cyanea NA-134]
MSELPAALSADTRAQRFADVVAGSLDRLFADLEPLRSTVTHVIRHGADADMGETIRAALEPLCGDVLARPHHIPLSGIGFGAEVGHVVPHRSWMAWWVRHGDVVRQKRHTLNPASDAFYDYNTAPWFTEPRRTGTPHIAGPFIDSWGTDDLTITASVPVLESDSFVGVVAADIAVRSFETATATQLHSLGAPAVLVNAEDRVIASGVADLTTGLRLSPRTRGDTAVDAIRRFPCGYGWSVVLRAA